jgi:hypothetical protein
MGRNGEYCRANPADNASAIGCCQGKGPLGPLILKLRPQN